MSFSNERAYGRHILKPLSPPVSPDLSHAQVENPKGASSTSASWRSTTHVFVGTGRRVKPKAWPAHRFSDDPALIPDDDRFDTKYDPATATPRPPNGGEDIYRLYDLQDEPSQLNKDAVPCPRLVVKRYIPNEQSSSAKDSPAITLLMLPGMGLPKEIFEPTIDTMLPLFHRENVNVQEIWVLDMPLSGETALLNPRGYLYGIEKDVARDVLMFVTGYLPLQPCQDLPQNLPFRRPSPTGRQPVRQNLHVVAHSLGGEASMLCAAHAPDIFASLTVLDPALIPGGRIAEIFGKLSKDVFCTGIAAEYPSREALMAEVKRNKRTRGWDGRAARAFVEHAVVETEKGTVRLAAHPRLEWALYYDKETPTHCYDRLLDIATPFNAIMPPRPFAVPPKMLEADVKKMAGPTRITWIPGTTHQIPFEKIDECASSVVEWIKDQVYGNQQRAKL